MKKLAQSLAACFAVSLLLTPAVEAQTYFQYNQYGNLLLGFRKTGANPETYELVVNIGNVTNFIGMSAGSSQTITQYTPTVLTDAFADGYANLQWSVSATHPSSLSSWVTPVGSFPKATLWLSTPSPDANTQSTPFTRLATTPQQNTRQNVLGVGSGAVADSTALVATNQDNNSLLVREPLTAQYQGNQLSQFIGDPTDNTVGDFGSSIVCEATVPGSFTASSRCDLYQSVPTGLTDPITHTTSGNAYFVGYFLLHTDGTLSFTRATATRTPPPPPTLTVSNVSGNMYNIYFTSSNSSIYTLYYTNLPGISAPRSTWATNSSTITGDGTVKFFSVTASDPNGQLYSVGGQ